MRVKEYSATVPELYLQVKAESEAEAREKMLALLDRITKDYGPAVYDYEPEFSVVCDGYASPERWEEV